MQREMEQTVRSIISRLAALVSSHDKNLDQEMDKIRRLAKNTADFSLIAQELKEITQNIQSDVNKTISSNIIYNETSGKQNFQTSDLADNASKPDDCGKELVHYTHNILDQISRITVLTAQMQAIKKAVTAEMNQEHTLDQQIIARQIYQSVSDTMEQLIRKQTNLQALLSFVTKHIEELEKFVQSEQSDWTEIDDSQKIFHENMELELSKIQMELSNNDAANILRGKLINRLEKIGILVKELKTQEDKLKKKSDQRILELNQKIEQMRNHSLQMETKIQQQAELIQKDNLTKLKSRYAYEQHLAQNFQKWQAHNNTVYLSLWDIDHFKKINDTYGHQTGDYVLKHVARLMQSQISQSEFLARIGGEEFALIFRDLSQSNVHSYIDKIRQLIAQNPYKLADHSGNGSENIQITVSCGYAHLLTEWTLEQWYMKADQALYEAKNNGRNQTIFFPKKH